MPEPEPFTKEGAYAVVDVCGPLVQHDGWFCDSYDNLRERCLAAFESDQPAVCLRINSPGGDFAGSIELAHELRALSKSTGKPLVAFTDSQALSAGYALACAASRLTITPSASVGSIGVWAALLNTDAQNRALGVDVMVVASGHRKVADAGDHRDIADLTNQIDAMSSLFFELVSEARGLAVDEIRNLEAAVRFGSEACALRLADNIVNSWGEFVASSSNKGKPMGKYEKAIQGLEEALKMLRAADDDGDDEKDDKKEAKASDDEKKEAKAEDEKKEKARAADDDDKKESKAAAGIKPLRVVAAASPEVMDLARQVQTLSAKVQANEEKEARDALLNSRPDLAPSVKAFYATLSVDTLRKAIEATPRGYDSPRASAGAIVPGGTRGDTQGASEPQLSSSDVEFIDRHMGLSDVGKGITRRGNSVEFGFMTPHQAREHLAKLQSKGGK
jgi:ClpP class serine protease